MIKVMRSGGGVGKWNRPIKKTSATTSGGNTLTEAGTPTNGRGAAMISDTALMRRREPFCGAAHESAQPTHQSATAAVAQQHETKWRSRGAPLHSQH